MANKGKISPQSIDLIHCLFKEPRVMEKISADYPKVLTYSHVLVDASTGRISFGRYNWSSWLGCFWNNLIKCYIQFSFTDFSVMVWDALVGMTAPNQVISEAILKGLSREMLVRGVHDKDYDWIINRFYDIARHLCDEGYWAEHGHHVEAPTTQQPAPTVQVQEPVQVVVSQHSPAAQKHYGRVVDAIGDTFEIVSWIGGQKYYVQ